MKYARKRFRVKKENGAIKDRIIKDIKTLLESEKEDYYKPASTSPFSSSCRKFMPFQLYQFMKGLVFILC